MSGTTLLNSPPMVQPPAVKVRRGRKGTLVSVQTTMEAHPKNNVHPSSARARCSPRQQCTPIPSLFLLMFSSVVELRATPVAALLVPLDAVAGAQADPVGDRPVLLQLLGVLLLDCEWLETTHDCACSNVEQSVASRIPRGLSNFS
ncbi:hypothetical protein TRVL_02871 [Trypanosoma vivax]|nr:hypothetical protein TRVL_02871 [Trypanosoma vivax]